jgi:hypothetical protein
MRFDMSSVKKNTLLARQVRGALGWAGLIASASALAAARAEVRLG